MSKLSKIEQTVENKKKYGKNSPLVILLSQGRFITREELKGVLNTSDKHAREEVAECSMHFAVISSSKQKGYRLAKRLEDMTSEELEEEVKLVEQSLAEDQSRVTCLKKKMKAKIAWLKKANEHRGV